MLQPWGGVVMCCACVGGGRVIQLFPVPSPCSGMGMVLGTGASFGEGFMLVAEAGIIAELEVAGLAAPTVVSYTHPPGPAKAGPGIVGSLGGGLWEAHPQGSVAGLQQTRVG